MIVKIWKKYVFLEHLHVTCLELALESCNNVMIAFPLPAQTPAYINGFVKRYFCLSENAYGCVSITL